jgi:hypothetical protein
MGARKRLPAARVRRDGSSKPFTFSLRFVQGTCCSWDLEYICSFYLFSSNITDINGLCVNAWTRGRALGDNWFYPNASFAIWWLQILGRKVSFANTSFNARPVICNIKHEPCMKAKCQLLSSWTSWILFHTILFQIFHQVFEYPVPI